MILPVFRKDIGILLLGLPPPSDSLSHSRERESRWYGRLYQALSFQEREIRVRYLGIGEFKIQDDMFRKDKKTIVAG